MIAESKAGRVADFNDKQAMHEILNDYYNAYLSGGLHNSVDQTSISRFSRRNLAREYAGLITNLIQKRSSDKL